MGQFVNETHWNQALSQPDWYVILADDFKRLEKIAEQEKDYSKRKQIKREAYELVENAVKQGRIPLGRSGTNLDKERKPIDTIVIHHTKNKPGMTLERLNAMQLLRIYGMYYANPTDEQEVSFKGQPVWSGHFYKGQQVFWGYHWLVREDGSTEQILKDEYIGWHAGNWNINTRSIGVCIDDDLSEKEPSQEVLKAVANIIKQHYADFAAQNIVGHCDVNKQTECPGHLFHESWQQKLQKYIA